MSRASALIILGTVTIIAPLSGLPVSLRSVITIICGALVVALGLNLRTATAPAEAEESEAAPESIEETGTVEEEAAPPMSAI